MVWQAMQQLPVARGGLLFIENVGNLICPALCADLAADIASPLRHDTRCADVGEAVAVEVTAREGHS